jgi:hypothetical protein
VTSGPEELRGRLEAALAASAPDSPTAVALVKQAVVAELEIERLQRIRATLRAAKIRTAEQSFEEEQADEVQRGKRLFRVDSDDAVAALKKTAAGTRFLITYWEELARRLETDGTWYGIDRSTVLQLQGFSACVEHLYFEEDAYWLWVWTLAAQPDPKPSDIELILRTDVMPPRLQDMGVAVWRPDPEEARARLHAIVAETLPALRRHEAALRTRYEEPARAEAVDRALSRISKDEIQLLRALRSHEQSLARAHKALAIHGGKY